ncbi:zinc-binding dehydrogenase [Companilactobacillus ginsenosidimutans]|uniref:zinc-binding dehydrogenase n=1 Tax=Companilactobacillus ginsenosidimutans TaxID=1007676 RepID=UPI000A9A1A1D|nr:zinc-binding dehydrogenase [Companilactobacillus ginsenosidimutans]
MGSTTRQAAREPELTKLGATDVILDQDGKLQTDKTFDNAIDLIGVTTSIDTLSHVKQGGFYSLVGMVTGQWIWKEFDPFTNLAGKFATVYDSTAVDKKLVKEMFNLINKNHLEIPIAKVFKLDEIQDAQSYVMEKNRPLGQVIVSND